MTEISFKDALGLVADLLAIFGIGGFFSWAFVCKSLAAVGVADAGVTVFAYAVKLFLVLVLLVVLAIPIYFSQAGIVLFASGQYGTSDGLWNSQKPISYALSYFATALWAIPLTVLCVSSIFTWSIEPFRQFSRAFVRKDA